MNRDKRKAVFNLLRFTVHCSRLLSPAASAARAATAAVATRAARAVFRVAVAAGAATVAALGPRLVDRVGLRAARHGRLRVENLAAVNPDLHSDGPEGRARLGEAVVNVCAQSVQREATL